MLIFIKFRPSCINLEGLNLLNSTFAKNLEKIYVQIFQFNEAFFAAV